MGDSLMYRIVLKKRAKKFLDGLTDKERRRIISAIRLLPDGEDIKKLKGYSDLFRLRIGDYRVIYTVKNGQCVILVMDIGNRGQIYNRY